MVTGLETFCEYFQNFTDDYVLIGGVACELALGSLRIEFRPTDDFDIVIVAENLTQGFGTALKKFILDGRYKPKTRKSNGKATFFCFLDPEKDTFPSKLELATVRPAEDWEWDFAPLDAGDNRSSLSAILFETEFYRFILDNATILQGISTMRLEGLIPLKCLVFLELSQQDDPSPKTLANIEKHRQDIFRLADALPDGTFPLPDKVASITTEALARIAENPHVENAEEILTMLRQFYVLS